MKSKTAIHAPQLPLPAPASLPLLSEGGVYLVDNGQTFILWVGRTAPVEWLQDVSVIWAGSVNIEGSGAHIPWV